MNGYHDDIEQQTKGNTDFRRVLYTGKHLQLVLMSLKPGEEIGAEVHPDNDQFFRVDSGSGVVGVGDVLTMHSSPDQITVLMSVDFEDELTAAEVEKIVEGIEIEAEKRWPTVNQMYVRPMSGAASLRLGPLADESD